MFLLIDLRVTERRHVAKNRAVVPAYRSQRNGDWVLIKSGVYAIQGKIRSRTAYPGTFCEDQADGSVLFGYGSRRQQSDDEFLHVRFDNEGGIHIQRDLFCTLPLFYGYKDGRFVVSNEYQEVVRRLPNLSIDTDSMCKSLLGITSERPYTLWKEIKTLSEREALIYKDGQVVFVPAAPRPWTFSAELAETNPRAFPGMIKDRLTRFIDTRLAGNVVGFELSGGLDSALLPLYMAKQGWSPTGVAGSMIQPAMAGQERQLQKIAALERVTGLQAKKIYLDPRRHYPLRTILHQKSPPPFDPQHELYQAPALEINEYFQAQGVTIAVTGCGGDQLLENRPLPSLYPPDPESQSRPSYLSSICREPEDTVDPYASIPTLLPKTIALENFAQANNYINHGIWPVSPFYDLPLFNYCQALPVQFRANKNIFRAFFEANRFPDLLYLGDNEDFGYFFYSCVHSGVYDRLISHLAANAVTHKLGYAAVEVMKELYASLRNAGAQDRLLFNIYSWIEVELNLQMTLSHEDDATLYSKGY
jgi:hypothetical protein